ncbi:hypothetical protein CBH50_004604 [Salmonella enterica subsp. diarizonae serovar 60:r:e,n,x,z15]|nr:hypothetical protein [Salmonella enterica subsp. diarizonae serovar 60:r:e,n,x,z15]
MFEKTIKYIFVYLMLLVSFMLFFTTLGYYIFVFSWGGSVMKIAINTVLLISLAIASVAIYYIAEKMKSRL